jgi:hypothetical protein
MYGDHQFTFQIDLQQFRAFLDHANEEKRQNLNQKLGEIKNTTILLNSLFHDDRGIDFEIRYEQPTNIQKPYEQLVEAMPVTAQPETHSNVLKPLEINAVNERGELAKFGERGTGSDHTYSVFIDQESFETSQRFNVTIRHLVYEIIGDWHSSITIPDGL